MKPMHVVLPSLVACALLAACDSLPKSGLEPDHRGPRTSTAWASAARGPTTIGAGQSLPSRRLFSGIRGKTQVYAMFVPAPWSTVEFVLIDGSLNGEDAAIAQLDKGYAYLLGRWPIVITKGGTGTGIGTKIAAWVDPDTTRPNHSRFFLINPEAGQELRVQLAGPGPTPTIYSLTKEGYVEVADENNDGVGEFIETKERCDAPDHVVWDPDAEEQYQLLKTNAEWYRLPF